MYVYKIENSETGDVYIGVTTKTVDVRFAAHVAKASAGSKTHLHRAIKKYGISCFSVTILEFVDGDVECLFEAERRWIQLLSPSYNMTNGGEGGDTSSSPNYKEAMVRRSSVIAGSNNPFFGRKHSPESRAAISKKKLGVLLSEDHKKAIAAAGLGRKQSKESIEKSARARSRPWRVTEPDGTVLVVEQLGAYCKEKNLDSCNLRKVAFGKYKHHKGYKCQQI